MLLTANQKRAVIDLVSLESVRVSEGRTQHLKHVEIQEAGGQVHLLQVITTRRNAHQSDRVAEHLPAKPQSRLYLAGVQASTELRTKHLSGVMRMLGSLIALIEARTSAVTLGF